MMDTNTINSLLQNGLFFEIDVHFAKFISGFSADEDADIFLAAAMVSHASGSGDICLNLAKVAGSRLNGTQTDRQALRCPQLDVWLEKIRAHPAVGSPGKIRPLVLDAKNRLYLYRYWDYENTLSKAILERARSPLVGLDFKRLKSALDRLFPENDPQMINWQKIAVTVASLSRFSVITGGPGTGKTFTVTKVLALLLEQSAEPNFKIYLTAPTGKAAARLKEVVKQVKDHLNCADSVKQAIPSDALTIHRLLGTVRGSPYFRHNRQNPLMADVVVVDEASMVDLALMAKLIEAVPENARLILIGDKDQLASVEAGSVLGDICGRDVMQGFSASFANRIKALTGEDVEHTVQKADRQPALQDAIVILQKSFRFAAGSRIGSLSGAVNRADSELAFEILAGEDDPSVTWEPLTAEQGLFESLSRQIVSGYQSYLSTDDPAEALRRLQRFKILCALNVGPLGVRAVNQLAEQVLRRQHLIRTDPLMQNPWYAGRPVLITRNHYPLGLFNGDIGVALPDAAADHHQLAVFFPADGGDIRSFQPDQLPQHETVYAMTVHKSQGSEFDEVLFILPERDFPVLTRELIYTALTRARQKISIWGNRDIIQNAMKRRIERTSGLRDALWDV
jgi:exodeoxyribonuclease V alpha subunit